MAFATDDEMERITGLRQKRIKLCQKLILVGKTREEKMEINNINLNDMATKIQKNISKKSKAPLMPEIGLKDFIRAKKEGYSALLRFDKMDNEKLIINYRDCSVYCLLSEIENYELGKQCETVVVDIDEEKREVWVSSKESKERFLEKKRKRDTCCGKCDNKRNNERTNADISCKS